MPPVGHAAWMNSCGMRGGAASFPCQHASCEPGARQLCAACSIPAKTGCATMSSANAVAVLVQNGRWALSKFGVVVGTGSCAAVGSAQTAHVRVIGCVTHLQGLAHQMGKPSIPRVQGGNPYVTPDSTVHDPKMQDVELGKKTGL